MPLSPGTRIGPYEIAAAIGAGGMGEVYRACDTRLGRDVAIKILPETFAADAERLARFEREARTLASLNHPNIAAIYGIEAAQGFSPALIMELVEGEDLSARIARGAIPLAEALPIARQITHALDAAHERGVIHRDLKPANIKLREDGTVKVLDFGLAKLGGPADAGPSGTDFMNSPTITSPATHPGMILGTAAYMSPEQARGKPVDKRADVWAFGCVLYEMLTARRAFPGSDVSETLASVLAREADHTALPAGTPAPITALLRACLKKDKGDRLRDLGDAWLHLDSPAQDPALQLPHGRSQLVPWAVAAAALIIAAAAGVTAWRAPDAETSAAPALRFALVSDPDLGIVTASTQPFAIAPDGRTVIFAANGGAGVNLWVRSLDAIEPRMLPGTAGAYQPAISPNGEWVAFVVANHLIRKMRISGGDVTTIVSLDDVTASVAWLSDDALAFELIGSRSGIHRVRAGGGPPELLIPLDASVQETTQRRPFVLRDERMLLYASSVPDGPTTIAMASLDGARRSRLGLEGIQALGVVDGHLIYVRDDGVIMAVPFDAAGMRVTGDPVELAERAARTGTGSGVALSESGTLAINSVGTGLSRLLLGDASGRSAPLGTWVREFDRPRFSPDGRRVAVALGDVERDLWVFDGVSGEATRVTRGARDTLAGWTSDGQALIHLRGGQVWTTPVDGGAEPRRLVPFEGSAGEAAILPDGRSVVTVRMNQGSRSGMFSVSIPEGRETVILSEAWSGRRPRPYEIAVSPDGLWIAYTDRNESEVHVRSMDGTRGLQVSAQGGSRPIWGRDSRHLYYESPNGLMRAQLRIAPALAVTRTPVSAAPLPGGVYDVSPDGKTFLMLQPVHHAPNAIVALDWARDVRRRLRK